MKINIVSEGIKSVILIAEFVVHDMRSTTYHWFSLQYVITVPPLLIDHLETQGLLSDDRGFSDGRGMRPPPSSKKELLT